jgi:hypothetical protein
MTQNNNQKIGGVMNRGDTVKLMSGTVLVCIGSIFDKNGKKLSLMDNYHDNKHYIYNYDDASCNHFAMGSTDDLSKLKSIPNIIIF